jgi:transcription initiation factor IIE alpha subunit
MSTKPPKIDPAKLEIIRERNRERGLIIKELKNRGPLTIEELAKTTGLDLEKVLKHVIALRQLGRIAVAKEKDEQYTYTFVR